MRLFNCTTQRYFNAVVEELKKDDYKEIAKRNSFEFDWDEEKSNKIYKIKAKRSEKILGLISLMDIPEEYRIHIQLIECAKENVGTYKQVDRVAGCLIAHACKVSFQKGYGGFVSLVPKTQLIDRYRDKYGFQQFGRQMAVEWEASQLLIKKYIDDEKI